MVSRRGSQRGRAAVASPAASPGLDELTALEEMAEVDVTALAGYDDRMLDSCAATRARRMPGGLGFVLGLAWRASAWLTIHLITAQLLVAVCTVTALLSGTTVLARILEAGARPDRLEAAAASLILTVGAVWLRAGAQLAGQLARAQLSPEIHRLAGDRLYAAVVEVDLVAFEDAEWFEAMTRARDRGLVYVELAVERLAAMIDIAVGLVSVAVVAASLHLLLLPLLILSAVPNAVAAMRSARMGYSSSVGLASLHHRRWLLEDLFTQRAPATDIRACGAQPYLVRLYRRLSAGVRQERRRVERAQVRREAMARLAGGAVSLTSYAALFLLLRSGHLPLAAAGTSALAIRTAQGGLIGLLGQVNVLYEYALYLGDLREFLADSARRTAPRYPAPAPRSFHEIRLDNVGFRYPNCAQAALTGVSLSIRRGEVIALVGENGSGKTTLAKILAGLFLPDQGTVTWDGQDLAEVDRRQVRARVALMAQEVTRWPLTARGNIVIGRHDRRDPGGTRLRDAVTRSGADRVLTQLPDGLRTCLSRHFRGGRELSSGQWQSLALARALYRDAPLLVCDEPTAALDPRAEQRSYEAIQVAAGREAAGAGAGAGAGPARRSDRAVVLITHRLASVRMADRIYVLDRGRVVECGTHDELLAVPGLYAQLYRIQAAGYVPTGAAAGAVSTGFPAGCSSQSG